MFDFKRSSRPITQPTNQSVGISSPQRIEKRVEKQREQRA